MSTQPDDAKVAKAIRSVAEFAGKPVGSLSGPALDAFADAALDLLTETVVERGRRKSGSPRKVHLRLVANDGELTAAGRRSVGARKAARTRKAKGT